MHIWFKPCEKSLFLVSEQHCTDAIINHAQILDGCGVKENIKGPVFANPSNIQKTSLEKDFSLWLWGFQFSCDICPLRHANISIKFTVLGWNYAYLALTLILIFKTNNKVFTYLFLYALLIEHAVVLKW
jgi:hypothetical protein